ncbi:unnamed protein product [Moneuplotes crassus]|uniref:Replication protein A subunit n=1 Tax=Euplotes crassus TaxID=5936 RepID=A0AAD1Y413_EUPCR|nr:unnamed protein product [Moneuplotes crassus]
MRFKLSDGFSSITVVLCKSDSTPTNDNTEYKKFGIVKIIRPRLLKVNKTNILTIQVNPEIIYGFSYNKIGTPIDYTERILTGNFPETVPTPYIDKDDIKAHIKGGIKCKRSLKDDCYTPIKVLNTYTHDWKIKVRVIKKNKRSWTNMKGSGVVMTLDLIDSASSQIQASFFNDAVLKFDNVIQENCVYTMTNGTVRPANKRFTSIDNNFCINFEIHGKIEKVEDEGVIADQAFDFKTAKQIADMEDIKTIDFIGVVHHVTPIVTINTKNGERKEKRTISMADDSGMSINLSIWGDQTTMIDFEQNPHPVIAIKGVKISLYGGKSLNLIRESTVSIDPQIKETERLKEWYKTFIEKESNQLVGLSFDSPGSSLDQAQATERLLIESDEFLHEQFSKAPDKCCYFCVNGYINNIKSDEKCIYMACPDETCSKKVYYQHDIQRYRCDTCNLDYEEAKPKFMLMVRFSDFTNTCYTFFYKDTAPLIMDCTPDVLKEFKNQGDNQSYSDAFTRQQYKKYKLLMRARIATYAGGTKVTYSAAKVMDYNFKNENHSLLERLALYDKKQTTPEQDMMMYNMEQEANFYGNGGINNFFGNTPTGFSRPNNMF